MKDVLRRWILWLRIERVSISRDSYKQLGITWWLILPFLLASCFDKTMRRQSKIPGKIRHCLINRYENIMTIKWTCRNYNQRMSSIVKFLPRSIRIYIIENRREIKGNKLIPWPFPIVLQQHNVIEMNCRKEKEYEIELIICRK